MIQPYSGYPNPFVRRAIVHHRGATCPCCSCVDSIWAQYSPAHCVHCTPYRAVCALPRSFPRIVSHVVQEPRHGLPSPPFTDTLTPPSCVVNRLMTRRFSLHVFLPQTPTRNTLYLPVQLQDAKHKTTYDLGASSARERAFWVETLTKASHFSKGSGEEQRHGALSKRFLVTTRPEGRRGVGLGDGALGRDGGVGGRNDGSGALKSR